MRYDEQMIRVRKAVFADAVRLPDIERSAGRLFRTIPRLAWLADDNVQSIERHGDLIRRGTTWVAIIPPNDAVGFLSAEMVEGNLHIHELSVCFDQQGQGIGRMLIETTQRWVRNLQIPAITLTTFRSIAWNEPFYRSIGFETLAVDKLTPRLARILAAETKAGLPPADRCAMIWKP
jgi:GNAT superfamily N-acetyltransferase